MTYHPIIAGPGASAFRNHALRLPGEQLQADYAGQVQSPTETGAERLAREPAPSSGEDDSSKP